MKTITMKFRLKTGETLIEANGFKGQSCKDATKFLKDSLGECTDFFIKEHNLAPLTYDDNWEIFGFEVEVTKPRMVVVERRRAMACLQARIS